MKIAAITYDAGHGQHADTLLAETAERLRTRGLKLAGSVQWNHSDHCDMILEDLASGRRFEATPANRKAAGGCRLDASVLEDVAGLTAGSIAPDIDLVIVNRFGKEELAGRGFRAVIEAAVSAGIPVLTSINSVHLENFNAFAGGEANHIAATSNSIEAWCASALKADGLT